MSEKTEKTEKTLKSLIEHVKIAMFTTVDEEGQLRSRPLATLDIDDPSELCFFTSDDAPKVDEVASEHQVNLAYGDPHHQIYVSVSGLATISKDRAEIKRYWKPIHKAWFPDGEDDPSIAIIRVRVLKAEYWDAPHGAIVNAIGLAKAIVTGERYEPGENKKLRVGG